MEPGKLQTLRCAIYTRKSSEEGLEQDFNSLHAQREACESFIRSQQGEGWRVIKTHYDDGGLSGATMDRPALQNLLEDIRQKLIDVFPRDTAPSFLLRDRDASYGSVFSKRVAAMGVTEVVTAPRSPGQNPHVERVIGSIRRECLDHVVIFNERHLRRVLSSNVAYYQRTRTHLSLDKDCPDPRPIQPRRIGRVVAVPQVGGLHHRYERLAA